MSHLDDEADIEASRAPLMEHLVELRQRLIICAAALAVGFGICFYFSQDIYFLLLRPFEVGARLLAAQKAAGSHGSLDLLMTLFGLKAAPAATQHLNLV
ncbi:MAG TPA: twin-arginine translocase subunit TatC, partial [Caulobacteraceae bacterium]|nr:twin-arginine translocase subunit TatC [Caulobacteraceae bacterium]